MLIRIKVFSNSKKEKLIKKSENNFIVFIKEKPEKGLANKAVVRLLSFYFNISKSRIILKKGGRNRSKIFEINI